MRDLKNYVWLIPFLGIILCSIALVTPAAFFVNTIWNHEITNWIWGFFYERINISVTNGFYSDPLQLIPSVISSLMIVICIFILTFGLIKRRDDLKEGSINFPFYLILAVIIIVSTIFWMAMMEFAEQQIYDLSMWGRYSPRFGMIGLFIGAGVIICGILITKKNF